jgi:hypothetical protein
MGGLVDAIRWRQLGKAVAAGLTHSLRFWRSFGMCALRF